MNSNLPSPNFRGWGSVKCMNSNLLSSNLGGGVNCINSNLSSSNLGWCKMYELIGCNGERRGSVTVYRPTDTLV